MTSTTDHEKIMNTKSILKKLAIFALVFTAYQTTFAEQSVDLDAFQSSASYVAKDDVISVDPDPTELEEPVLIDFKLSINLDLGKTINGFVRRLITQ